MQKNIIIIVGLLLVLTKASAQSITSTNAAAIATTETDSMRVKLQLDSVQALSVGDIQTRYYDSVANVSPQLDADARKNRMHQLQTWRNTALQTVLLPAQWALHQQYMEEKRIVAEQRIQQRREQRKTSGQ